jgi:hypothetical protein
LLAASTLPSGASVAFAVAVLARQRTDAIARVREGHMVPLALDSPRWVSLKAHFGNAGVDADLPSVPSLIARWNRAVGSYAEEYEYEDLFESYLHQSTILDVAYAVVPHLAARLSELDPDRRLYVIDDLAVVEKVRLRPPREVELAVEEIERTMDDGELRDLLIKSTRDRNPPLPDDLAPAYVAAVFHAKAVAGGEWGLTRSEQPGPPHFRRHVHYLRSSGWMIDDITFGVETLLRESQQGQLVYLGSQPSLDGLRSLPVAPPGWFERTGLCRDDAPLRLAFRALYSLAWLAAGARTRATLEPFDAERDPHELAVMLLES